MKCRDLYTAAIHLLREAPVEQDPEDYEERAPYLIANVCSECAQIDREYRSAFDEGLQGDFNPVFLPLENEFPLSDRFAPPAVAYLAAMLVMDEDLTLSDRLFERYCDSISTICREIPAHREAIINSWDD